MKFLDMLKKEKTLPDELSEGSKAKKIPQPGTAKSAKSPFDGFDSTTSRAFSENIPELSSDCQQCPALELIDASGAVLAGCAKTLPPGSPWRQEWRRISEGSASCPDKPKTATGYGCGRCGSPNYTQGPGGWCCDGCGKIYHIIGGSRGPRLVIH
ncbi:hypothetical protein [Desulfurivibrio alkaliphilus]|uniref:hypothetical protein n=1 Tax=Desulfurivibrio alkaliphilus TaxID=427923 RepID=UPI0012FF0C97|nr:hypothetical protein [Desulfurivibrio alkaliphilus]